MWGWEPQEFHEFQFERTWWKPWTWQPIGAVVTRESEFTPDQLAHLKAHLAVEAERGPHGFSMREATDIKNQFAFVGSPIPSVDYAEKARLDAESAYYTQYDSKDRPVNRHGHIFKVHKRPD